MRHRSRSAGLLTLLIASAAALGAQTATTGSISGIVAGPDGAPVSGANIRLTSGQVTRTAQTGSDGRFHMGLLNSGAWQISISKAGFVTASQSLSLSINETRSLNLKLAPEGGATVEVVGTATGVDKTSTSTGLNMNLTQVQGLPLGRAVNDMVMLSPGVVSAGTTFGSGAPGLGVSINGASGAENSFIVDGLVTNDFRYGGTATNLPSEFIESVDVQTGGYKPEFSALGGVFSVVTKSGTNEFKGSVWTTFEPYRLQAINKRNDYFNQATLFAAPPVRDPINNGDSASRRRSELGGTAGGAIIKDKFFYQVGANLMKSESPSFLNLNNIEVGKRTEDDYSVVVKLNYFLGIDHQLTFSFFGNEVTDDAPHDRPAQYGDADRSFKHTVTSNNFSLVYDWTIQSDLLLSVKAGVAKIHDVMTLGQPNLSSIEDTHWYNGGGGGTGTYTQQKNPYLRGGFGRYNPNEGGTTNQLKADLSWFLGTHNLKFGVATLTSEYHRTAATSGGGWYIIRAAGDRIDHRNQYDDCTVKAQFDSLYAQDTWDLLENLKVFYGFRYERQIQKDADGNTFLKFDSFSDYAQPRIGFTYDPANDGKTKVSGSFARYFEQIPQRLAARQYGHEYYKRYRYGAGAPGTTFTYDPNGIGTFTGPGRETDFGGPYSHSPLAEGTKLPRRTEYTLGFDRTLANGVTVGLHAKHRTMDSILEDSVIRNKNGDPTLAYDPQERAILWNPGRAVSWTTQTGEHYSTDNSLFDPAKNVYDAVDITLEKRTQHSYINFSYTWSRLEGNYQGLVSSSNGQADASITASFDEWPYVGYGVLPLDRTHVVKLLASQNWEVGPGVFTVGLNWVYQTGTPISLFDDGSSTLGLAPGTNSSLDVGGYGNAIPDHFQLGNHGRKPSTSTVDLKLEYSWSFSSKVRLIPSIDVFNAFNTRKETRVLEQATDSGGNADLRYGEATDWQRGRSFRFGLKATF